MTKAADFGGLLYDVDVDVEKLWAQADASMPISSILLLAKLSVCRFIGPNSLRATYSIGLLGYASRS